MRAPPTFNRCFSNDSERAANPAGSAGRPALALRKRAPPSAAFPRFVAGLVTTLVLGAPAHAENVSYEPGAYIVDMGNATNNGTTAKGLLGYGFVYDAVRNMQAPVDWIIKPGKTTQGEVDFIGPGSKAYSSSAFIVSKDYAPLVTALVATYKSKGALIDGPTATPFVAPRQATLRSVPNIRLDTQNGRIVAEYLKNANICSIGGGTSSCPSGSVAGVYAFGQPTALDACDDVFALPHADPTWTNHGNLVSFNTTHKGFIWGACHAVSVLENLEPGDDPDQDVLPSDMNPPEMNFLSNYSTVAANQNRSLLHYNLPTDDSHKGDGSYDYITSEWSNPFMQFIGDLGPATENGSEQIFMPVVNASWRATTTVAIWDANHPYIPGLTPGKAAKLAWGRGFGNDQNGMVMYLGGHNHDKSSAAANVAAQRTFFNFLLQAGVEKVIASDINITLGTTACPGSSVALTANASGGNNAFTYQWSSSCGGAFSAPTGQHTNWTIPAADNGTTCFLKVIVRDGCQRFAFQTVPVTIGDPEADLSVTVDGAPDPVFPNDIATYTVLAFNGGPETVTDAVVDVTLPTGVTFLDAAPGAAYDSATRTWTIGTLAQNHAASLTVRTTVGVSPTGTHLTAAATIGATSSLACTGELSDPDLTNNTDSDFVTVGAECLDGSACNDDNACTNDACVAGSCLHTAVGVSDNNACTIDTCNPNTGVMHTPVAEGTACGSTDATGCNAPDTCNAVGACIDRKDPSSATCTGVSQGGPCDDDGRDHCSGTTDGCVDAFLTQGTVCRPETGGCDVAEVCTGSSGVCPVDVALPAGHACDDDNACTTTDACDAGGVCVGSGALVVDDHLPCTDDACDPMSGAVHTPNTGKTCSDGNACTTLDVCASGVCVGGGSASNLDDHDLCTRDACDPTTGAITHFKVDPACCSLNGECNSGEICDESIHRCTACRDSTAYAPPSTASSGIDDGCGRGDPVCNTLLQPNRCVVCMDTTPSDRETDEGCPAALPICQGDLGAAACVECNDDADCSGGRVCDVAYGLCVVCAATGAGGLDPGCTAEVPVCALANPGIADDHCVACEDDHGPGLIDRGCDEGARFCDMSAAGGPSCLVCEADEDCPGEHLCVQGTCVDPGATVAVDDTYTMIEGTTLAVSAVALGLAGNDVFPAGSATSVEVVTGTAPDAATEGTLTLAVDGTFTFVPMAGYAGTVAFSYTLTSLVNGATSTAGVALLVHARPRALDDTVTTDEDVATTFDPRTNDRDPNGGTLTIARLVSPPAHGAANLTEALVYTPNPNYHGPDSLVYEVCNATPLCATATVRITVLPIDDRPAATDDLAETPEDTGVLVVVLANDIDVDSAMLEVTHVTAPSHGTVTIAPDKSLLYAPAANFSGLDAFTYQACDSDGACDLAVVKVTVAPVNDAPVAGDDQTTTRAQTAVSIAVLRNDSDVDGDPLAVSRIALPPDAGSVRLTDGTLTFTPAAGATVATFSYEVCDPSGLCDSGQVRVLVGLDNEPPRLIDDVVTTSQDRPVTIAVLDNDRDPDGTALTLQQVGLPSTGSATRHDDGTLTFTPVPGFEGEVSFSYTACDADGACATALVTVTVLPGANRPPIAVDDLVGTRSGEPVNLDPTDNDVDPDGDLLAVDDLTQPTHGTVALEADGSVTYTPEQGFDGSDSFEVSVADGRGGFSRSTVTVAVAQDLNEAPIATDDAYDVPDNLASELAVLENDSDPDGDPLVIVDVVQPRQGIVSIIVRGDTRLSFTPNPGAHGEDSFTYTISDLRGGKDQATVKLSFPLDNLPPVAIGESVITPEDTAVLIVLLANDSDPEGGPFAVTGIATAPRHGEVTLDDGGLARYLPAADYVGFDVFAYQVCDEQGACDTAVVAVEVTALNDGPRASDDAYSVPADALSALEVTLNDSDPELDPLAVRRIVSPPQSGRALLSDDAVTYEPAGTTGTYTFTYEVCDPFDACDLARVTLFVGDGNHDPRPSDDVVTTTAGVPVIVDVLSNDTDPDGDALTLFEVEDPPHGLATVDGAEVVYTPDGDYQGTDSFFYTVCDPGDACATALVAVAVTPGENTPPTAVDDTLQTREGTSVTFDPTLNDVDFEGDVLTVAEVSPPAHGSVTINPDGTLTFTPEPGFTGEVTFTVTVSDGRGGTSTQAVLVIVTPADNRPPEAADDSYDAPSDDATVLAVLDNDSDPDGDALQIVDVVEPQHGVVTIAASGSLILTPDPTHIGPDRMSYTITDHHGGYAQAEVDLYLGDRDRDGLGDRWEVEVTHTDPDDFDTDHDGLGDGAEIAAGDPLRYDVGIDADPLDADTDGDGVTDGNDDMNGDDTQDPGMTDANVDVADAGPTQVLVTEHGGCASGTASALLFGLGGLGLLAARRRRV